MICLTLPLPPSINHYYEVNANGGKRIGEEGKLYRNLVLVMAQKAKARLGLNEPLRLLINIYLENMRYHDLDNILKCLFDSMQFAGIYTNDNWICKLGMEKVFCAKKNHLELQIATYKEIGKKIK